MNSFCVTVQAFTSFAWVKRSSICRSIFKFGFLLAVSPSMVGLLMAKEVVGLTSNALRCSDLTRLAQDSSPRSSLVRPSALFQEYKSGDTVEIRIPSEELLDVKFLSGKYKVGPNSSIRLSDGHLIYRKTPDQSLERLIFDYISSIYGYRDIIIGSSDPPSVDFSLRGEVPLQSFLITAKSQSSAASSDLQANSSSSVNPNSLSDFLKSRRPFTIYSDLNCIAIIRGLDRKFEFYNLATQAMTANIGQYVPLFNGDIVYVPLRDSPISGEEASSFSASPYASDVQISITGWGVRPTVKTAPSGTSLFEMLVTAESLQRGFSSSIKVFRYDTVSGKYSALNISYPRDAQSFYPKDKDIVSVGKDIWSSTLSSINELAAPLATALSSFFFFRGLIGF